MRWRPRLIGVADSLCFFGEWLQFFSEEYEQPRLSEGSSLGQLVYKSFYLLLRSSISYFWPT